MSYPSEGFEGLYRNPFDQVKNRKEKQYDLSRFENAANYPFLDHQAPSFGTLVDFCNDASGWLDRDKENVVVIHCKAGKGRTGTVIAALLLHIREANDAKEAIALYDNTRTSNQKGITIPSQRRYVYYYDIMIKNRQLYDTNKDVSIQITQIVIHDLPQALKHSKEFILLLLDTDHTTIYQKSSNEVQGSHLFSFWLNPTFMYISNDNAICLKKQDIDLAFRDKNCKNFSQDFSVGITFQKSSHQTTS
ncbi:protein-tyrosine phosphatase-like protein [Parasitella parasitica]|nr:protein-tyrosine phosphatase-like protein [Parasitella parasitica]